MSSLDLDGTPYRTRPEFLRSRFEQQLPGPYYGNRKRLREDIITRTPKEWRPDIVKSKFDPSLRGLSGDDPATVGFLKQKVHPLLKKTADGLANEVLGIKKTLDLILKYEPNVNFDVQYPQLTSAWRSLGDLYGNAAAAIQEVERLIGASSKGWSREDTDLFNDIKIKYETSVNALSAEEKKQSGLSGVFLIILGVGLGLAAIIYGWRQSRAPRPYVEIAKDKIAGFKEINADTNLTPSQKRDAEITLREANPDKKGDFFKTLGWVAVAAVGLWAAKVFLVDTGVIGSVGRGIGGRIALGGSRKESASERSIERAKYYSAEVEAKKAEMALAKLSAPKTPKAARPSSSRPPRKHRRPSKGKRKTQSLMFPPGFTP